MDYVTPLRSIGIISTAYSFTFSGEWIYFAMNFIHGKVKHPTPNIFYALTSGVAFVSSIYLTKTENINAFYVAGASYASHYLIRYYYEKNLLLQIERPITVNPRGTD